ncbi:MAG: hypothetical protein KJ964_00325 [Verrucomicrobia bacterium]|nr:hypothetical protein [Verrucomicrobiota bacterium]MBU1857496.1 hypothetical protein [Verrucomicrobiota bacterium]
MRGLQIRKFVILGGGGLGVVPPFVDMARFPEVFAETEVALYDVDAQKAELMAQFLNLTARAQNVARRARAYTDLAAACEGADFLLSRFRPGGSRFQATGVSHTHALYRWANDCGYFADDTAAPVAVVMYLEGIDTTMQVVRVLERVAPQAWFLNYTNPTQVMADTIWRCSSIRAVGLCPGYLNACHDLSLILGDVRPEEISVRAAGVNHHTWVFDCRIRGEDGYALLRRRLPTIQRDALQPYQRWALETWERVGYFPAPAGHMQPAFSNRALLARVRAGLDAHWDRPLAQTQDTSAGRWEFIRQCVERNAIPSEDPRWRAFDYNPWTPNLEVHFATAVASGQEAELQLNLPNRGLLPDLPEDAVVEGPTRVCGGDLKQLPVGRLQPAAVPVLVRLCDFTANLTAAYLRQDPGRIRQALAAHPATESETQAATTADDILKRVGIPVSR